MTTPGATCLSPVMAYWAKASSRSLSSSAAHHSRDSFSPANNALCNCSHASLSNLSVAVVWDDACRASITRWSCSAMVVMLVPLAFLAVWQKYRSPCVLLTFAHCLDLVCLPPVYFRGHLVHPCLALLAWMGVVPTSYLSCRPSAPMPSMLLGEH